MDAAPATLEKFIEAIDKIALDRSHASYLRMLGASDWPTGPANHAGQLQAIFAAVQSAFPACSTTLPSGKQWSGTKLPRDWASAQVLMPARTSDKPTNRASLLHLASAIGVRPKWIGWLLASGVNPVAFHQDTGNSALGQMAYTGDASSVRVLRRAGVDLTLRLDVSHVDMSKPGSARMAGTTLLHRMVNRAQLTDGSTRQVVDELLLGGLSPLELSLAGETPIDMCRDPLLRQHLERHVAKKSKRSLKASTKAAPPRGATPRPRL